MTLDALLSHFENVKKNGAGWSARCPGHDDRRNSLSIRQDGDKLLLKCHAGCETRAVLDSVGLELSDLFERPGPDGHGPKVARPSPQGRQTHPLDWLADYCAMPRAFLDGLPLSVEEGQIAFTFGGTARKLRPTGAKSFFWRPPGSPTPPLWPMPPASLPETVWLAEGETDCIVARYIGLDAYGLTHGAGTPLTSDQAASLKARGVERAVVVFDCDQAGRDGARKLAAVLSAVGIVPLAANLDALGLVDPLTGSKDLRDTWLALRDREALRERLSSVATTASLYTWSVVATLDREESAFISADDLAGQSGDSGTDWLPLLGQVGFVGPGLFTLLSARPKAGKTTLVAHAAKSWLALGLKVAWLSEEPKAKWRERIAALGLSSPNLLLAFPDGSDVQTWCDRLRAVQPEVIVIDTARTFLGILDENDAAMVHRCLFPVMLLARELNAALVVQHHRRKADGEEGTDHAGSHAYVGECDVAVSLREDSASPRRRQLDSRSRFDETPPKLLLELSEDGHYRALGVPEQVNWGETRRRVQDALSEDWQPTGAICDGLAEPRPNREFVRRALHQLVADGLAERQQGRGTRPDQWRLAASVATTEHVYTDAVVATLAETHDDPACTVCGGPAFCYGEDAKPYCAEHAPEGEWRPVGGAP